MNLSNFKDYLKLNVTSKNSQRNYYSRLKCFFDEYPEFTQENVNQYLSKKLDTIKDSSFNPTLTAFRHYCAMAKIQIDLPRFKRLTSVERDYLTEKELLQELIPYFSFVFARQGEFFAFVVKLLFYTGVRPDELTNLKTKDIDFAKQIFIVRNTKTRKDKKVAFPSCMIPAMKKYLQTSEEQAYKITYQQILYIFTRLNQQLKYKKKIKPYMLRHGGCHYMLDNGIPVEKVQILMGHSNIKTTMIYAKPKEEDALKAYFDKINPKGR